LDAIAEPPWRSERIDWRALHFCRYSACSATGKQMIDASNPTGDSARVKPTWPLKHAIILGCIALVVTFLVVLTLTTSVPKETLASREFVLVETILQSIVLLSAACLYLVIIRKDNWRDFWESIHWHSKRGAIAAWSLIGLLVSVLVQQFTGVSAGIKYTSSPALMSKLILYTLLSTVLVQPLIEEVYFRGILFEALTSKVGWIWSISIVTMVFALLHVQHQWVVLPIAIVLAVARISTGSTATCFALHMSYNLGIAIWEYWPVRR
jgi:membrane protease YdiL (CAAX protease family)